MRSLIIKNVLIHLMLGVFYLFSKDEIADIPKDKLDTLLLFVGLIVIAPITSNFIYSYNSATSKKALYWGHVTTFFSMLVIGILFVILDVLLVYMIGNVIVFRASLLLFWIAVVTFDFADLYTREE